MAHALKRVKALALGTGSGFLTVGARVLVTVISRVAVIIGSLAIADRAAILARALCVRCLLGVLSLMLAGTALAQDYSYLSQFGTYGSGNGQFDVVIGVAIDPASHNIVVIDQSNHRVQIFNSSGEYLSQFGTSGNGNGQFNYPYGVTIDPSSHNIVVTDRGNQRVQIFDAAGEYLSQFGSAGLGNGQFAGPSGIAIDPTSHNIVVTDDSYNRVQIFNSAGEYLSQFGTFGNGNGQFNFPSGVAIDPSSHNILVAEQFNHRVQIFNSSGEYLSQFGTSGNGNGQFNYPHDVTIDPSNHNIVVADSLNNRVQIFSSAGEYLSQFGTFGHSNGQFSLPLAVAIDPTSHNILVADAANERVQIFALTPLVEQTLHDGTVCISDSNAGASVAFSLTGLSGRFESITILASTSSTIDDAMMQVTNIGFATGTVATPMGPVTFSFADFNYDFDPSQTYTFQLYGRNSGDGGAIYSVEGTTAVTPYAVTYSPGHLPPAPYTCAMVSPYFIIYATATPPPPPPSPIVSLSSTSILFPDQVIGSTGTAQAITLTNSGNADLVIGAISLAGVDPADFILAGDNCSGATLPPSQACLFSVAFSPTILGTRSAAINIPSNAVSSPDTVALTGMGVAPTPALPTISVISPSSGVAGTVVTIIGNNFGTSQGSSVVLFGSTPATVNTWSDTQIVMVAPTGLSGPVLVTVNTAAGTSDGITFIYEALPAYSLDTTFIDFGTIAINTSSSARVVTLTNAGGTGLTVSGIVIAGTNPGDFVIAGNNCSGTTLAPAQTCSLSAAFSPTDLGPRAAVISIQSNATSNPTVTLTGNGVAPTVPVPLLPSATPPLSLFPPPEVFHQSLYPFTQTSTAQFSPDVAQNLGRLGTDVKPLIDSSTNRWLKRTASVASEDIAQSAKILSGISSAVGVVTGSLIVRAGAVLSQTVDGTILNSWIEADPVSRSISNLSDGLLATAGCWDAARASGGAALQLGAVMCLVDWTSILMENDLVPALKKFAADPPDPDYTTVFQASVTYVPDVAKTGNAMIDSYVRQTLDAASRAPAYLNAVNRSFDKYAGAYHAGNPDYAALQMQAFLMYLRLYDEAMKEVQMNISAAMSGLDPAELAALMYDPAPTVALQNRLQATGFTDREIRFLTGIGFQPSDLETIRARLIAFDADAMKGDFLGAVRLLQTGVAQASTADNPFDSTPPSISIASPSATVYLLRQVVVSNYTCRDADSGVASCAGPVPSGGNIDTASVGTKTFTVSAADIFENTANSAVNYTVTYRICPLYDQTRAYRTGSAAPVKLQLCDANGANVSVPSLVVHGAGLAKRDSMASSLVEDSGSANPDNDFRFDPALGGTGGYIFNLSTKGLTTGTWVLNFTATEDPIPHAVQFDVK